MKYHYDNENRIIMAEEYSVFLKKFQIIELYFYNTLTERLRLSSKMLAVLKVNSVVLYPAVVHMVHWKFNIQTGWK